MGVSSRVAGAALLSLPLLLCVRCHVDSRAIEPAVAVQLVAHQANVDASGLCVSHPVEALKITCGTPENWVALPLHKNLLYVHQQWRSPTRATGVGAVYIRMPLPLSAAMLAHFARNEYGKHDSHGKVQGEWSDRFGRQWFEAENTKYHARGYVVVSGFDAWIIYSGYKLTMPENPRERELARRCMETILPEGVERAADMAREPVSSGPTAQAR